MICMKVFVAILILKNSSGFIMPVSVEELEEGNNTLVKHTGEHKHEYNTSDKYVEKIEIEYNPSNKHETEDFKNSTLDVIELRDEFTISTRDGMNEDFNITDIIEMKDKFNRTGTDVFLMEEKHDISTTVIQVKEQEYNNSGKGLSAKDEENNISANDTTVNDEENNISGNDTTVNDEENNISVNDTKVNDEENNISVNDTTVNDEENNISANDITVKDKDNNIFTTDTTVEDDATNKSANDITMNEESLVPSCNGEDYCDRPAYYPAQKILDLMSKASSGLDNMFSSPRAIEEMFSRDMDNMFSSPKDIQEMDIIKDMEDIELMKRNFGKGRKVGSLEKVEMFGEGDNVCPMLNFHIRPKVAMNTRGKFVFVVNAPDDQDQLKFVQVVQTGQCIDSGASCLGAWPGVRTTECRQQFLEHKLVAVDLAMKEIVVDTFRFPSCCTCHLRHPLDL